MSSPAPEVRCREITPADLAETADLLTRGFPGRRRNYWRDGLQRQALREVPDGYPRFGYLLEHHGRAVGVLLLIHAIRGSGTQRQIWCNLSSWYVEPGFRSYAPMLTRIAQRLKEVSYVNISAARPTWPIVEAQGFEPFCKGLLFSLPAFAPSHHGSHVEIVPSGATAVVGLAREEAELLARHAGYGCLSIVVRSARDTCPFVLLPFRIRRGRIALPAMQLVYCRDIADYVACAGAIGRILLRRGTVSVLIDANGPVPGLIGLYTELRGRKYCKGPHRPRLGDLSDTELVIYGA